MCRGRGGGWGRFFHDGSARGQDHGGNREEWSKNNKFFHNWSCSFKDESVQVPRLDVFRAKIFSLRDVRPQRWKDNHAKVQSSILVLNFFSLDLRRLPSRIRLFKARGRGERWRRTFSRRLSSTARSSCQRRSIASSSLWRASLRLRACERESCTVTRNPEGKWRNVTAVDTLLTFWPPGPPDRAKISSSSDSRTPSSFIRCSTDWPIDMRSATIGARCFRGRGVTRVPSTRAHPETCLRGARNSRRVIPRFH